MLYVFRARVFMHVMWCCLLPHASLMSDLPGGQWARHLFETPGPKSTLDTLGLFVQFCSQVHLETIGVLSSYPSAADPPAPKIHYYRGPKQNKLAKWHTIRGPHITSPPISLETPSHNVRVRTYIGAFISSHRRSPLE